MIERVSLDAEIVTEIRRRAAAEGISFELYAGRLMAEELPRLIAEELEPVVDYINRSAAPVSDTRPPVLSSPSPQRGSP